MPFPRRERDTFISKSLHTAVNTNNSHSITIWYRTDKWWRLPENEHMKYQWYFKTSRWFLAYTKKSCKPKDEKNIQNKKASKLFSVYVGHPRHTVKVLWDVCGCDLTLFKYNWIELNWKCQNKPNFLSPSTEKQKSRRNQKAKWRQMCFFFLIIILFYQPLSSTHTYSHTFFCKSIPTSIHCWRHISYVKGGGRAALLAAPNQTGFQTQMNDLREWAHRLRGLSTG